jgi:hypothetical protein
MTPKFWTAVGETAATRCLRNTLMIKELASSLFLEFFSTALQCNSRQYFVIQEFDSRQKQQRFFPHQLQKDFGALPSPLSSE